VREGLEVAESASAELAAAESASTGSATTGSAFAGPASPPDDGELTLAARDLEGRHPLDVLVWASERFAPRLAFATGFGAEGCVLIDLIGRHRLPVDVFTLDTGLLFPETRELWQRLEERYDLTIRGVQPEHTVDEQAARHGERLWAREPDRCCELRKVRPLRTALAGHLAWVAAIRRDQTTERAGTAVVERDARSGLVKVSPLAAWSSTQVWAYLLAHGVPTNPLHSLGYPSVGCWPCTSAVTAGEDPRAGRWRGHAKTECGLHLRPRNPLQPNHDGSLVQLGGSPR
jgi:phosphoadenylyl-sulfate reductase (thioredoxin)